MLDPTDFQNRPDTAIQRNDCERPLIGQTCRSRLTAGKLIQVSGERPVFKMANSHYRPQADVRTFGRQPFKRTRFQLHDPSEREERVRRKPELARVHFVACA